MGLLFYQVFYLHSCCEFPGLRPRQAGPDGQAQTGRQISNYLRSLISNFKLLYYSPELSFQISKYLRSLISNFKFQISNFKL
jgi:hypothetical protein